MKRIVSTLAVVLLFATVQVASAQTTSQETWKEKDEFHQVMAQTFHPMEEGNLEPIKARSEEMLTKVLAWSNSKAPESMNNESIRKNLTLLTRQVRELNLGIKSKSFTDEQIKTEFTKTHDTFHQIVGLCDPNHKHEHGAHPGHDHSDPNHKH